MFDMLSRWPAHDVIGLVAVLGGATCFVVWIIAHYWHQTRKLAMEIALKKDMLHNGMSAADIERVIRATGSEDAQHAAGTTNPAAHT